MKNLLLILIMLSLPALCLAQYNESGWPVVNIGSGPGTHTVLPAGNITWLAGHVYHIGGFIFLDNGCTLTIQPGTIVKGDPGQADQATALIVSRGAKIIAKGTPKLPIIMTTWLDNVGDTADLPDIATSKGLWGGLILEGKSYSCVIGGESAIEGVPAFAGIESLSKYGGGLTPDCHDNSGDIEYVSIRYPGSILAPNVEINGLTLAAVGDGTIIDHIDVYYSADDDIEFFGGSVNVLHSSIFYGDDDGWDTDECWSGLRQFGVMVKDPRWGDRETENDGRQQAVWADTTSAGVAIPSDPVLKAGWGCAYPSYGLTANMTLIGQGPNWSGASDQGSVSLFRDNLRAYYYNNVFTEQPKQAVQVESKNATFNSWSNTTANLPGGVMSDTAVTHQPLLDFVGNYWYKSYNLPSGPANPEIDHFTCSNAAGTAFVKDNIFPGGDTASASAKNYCGIDPKLANYTLVSPPPRLEQEDPRPAAGSPLIGGAKTVPAYALHAAYTPVTYVGAFPPNEKMWCQDRWCTAYDYRILPYLPPSSCGAHEGQPVKTIGSGPGTHTFISNDLVLSADTIWHLEGFIFVDSGFTCFIEPGTVIKGEPGQADQATALIIAPGARIMAMGTKEDPIIMTTWLDNVDDPNDLPDIATSKGLWGGLIIEGKSYSCVVGGTSAIEGVPVFTGHERASQYGGGLTPDCHDNSGIVQYVSIRYPGSILAPNVEINGLTLAGVGDGTTIDHIEVFYSADDDIEFFGGNVDVRYSVLMYGDDDGWDTDECWSGVRQFGFMLKDPRWGDRETESDGRQGATWTDTTSAGVAPAAVPSGWGCAYPSYGLTTNVTCIGQGPLWSGASDQGSRQLYRDNLRAYYYNNVYMEQPKQVLEVENKDSDALIDALQNTTRNLPSGAASLAAGHPLLDFAGNFWWNSYNYPTFAPANSTGRFVSSGDTLVKPLSTARVRNDIFPAGNTTITGKNHLVNPKLTSYELVSPPVRHGIINPVPAVGSPLIGAATAVPAYATPHPIVATTYAGAFDPNIPLDQSWAWGWTASSVCYNILGTNTNPTDPCCIKPGDANYDKAVNVGDAVFVINYVFKAGTAPWCKQSADANHDGHINVGDAVSLINYVFKAGAAPQCGPAGL